MKSSSVVTEQAGREIRFLKSSRNKITKSRNLPPRGRSHRRVAVWLRISAPGQRAMLRVPKEFQADEETRHRKKTQNKHR